MKSWSNLICIVPSVLLLSAAGCTHMDHKNSASANTSSGGADRFTPQFAAAPVQAGAGQTLRTIDGAVGSGNRMGETQGDMTGVLAAHTGLQDVNPDANATDVEEDYLRATEAMGRRSLPFFPVFAIRPW